MTTIDEDFLNLVQSQLMLDEEVIWEGKPDPPFTITILELGENFDMILGLVNRFRFATFTALAAYFGISLYNYWMFNVLAAVIILFLMYLPDIMKYYRGIYTSYIVTNRRICFKLWYWGRKSVHFVDLADVARITWQEYEDKTGILHFLPIHPFDFDTYDFISGLHRHYPTFEHIHNVIDLYEKIEPYRIARIQEKRHNQSIARPMKIQPQSEFIPY